MKCKKWQISLLIATVLALGLWPAAAARTQGAVQVTPGEADLTNFPDISLPVAVVNANGVPILDLQAENFEALEDDSPVAIQEVTTRRNPDLTIAVALVVDLSGSAPIEDVKEAAHQFLSSLRPNDRVALIGFNTPMEIDTFAPAKEINFTSDLDAVRAVVDGLVSVGESAVYEAIYKGVLITAEEIADRRAVIVMTDGYDTASRSQIATADTPKTAAKGRGIPIFTVGVYYPAFLSDPDYLKILAQETGGVYRDREAGDLGTLFTEVVDQLRTEYHLTLHTDLEPDGKDHVLKIRATTPQGVGEAERTVTYPAPSPIPRILKPQRDVNGVLQDVEAGAEVKGRVLLVPQISAQNPLVRVEYYVDGLLAYTADVEAMQGQEQHEPWEWNWDTCTVAEGDHTLEIVAYDDAGNASDRFSLGLRTTRSPWCVITENMGLVVNIVAAVIFLALVLFLVQRRLTLVPARISPTAQSPMSPTMPGPGPSTWTAPPSEPPTTPHVAVTPEVGYRPTAVVGPAPVAGVGAAVAPPPPETISLRREPQAMGWLMVEKGPRAGQEFRLQEVTAIGRSGDNDIILDDPSVSRQHAKVRLEGQTFTIFDLGATNSIKVKGQEIGKHTLVDGDRIEIGQTVLVFKQIQPTQAEGPPAPTVPAPLAELLRLPPRTINRFPDVSLRDKVALNQRCTLRVAVTRRPVREELEEHVMTFTVPPGVESTTVDVLVTAEDLEIIGDHCHPLVVPVDGDSEPILFQMVPRAMGEKKVKVEFFQDSRYTGGVTATTTVVMPAEAIGARPVSIRGIVGLEREASPPDLTILITESKSDGDQMRYTFKLHSPANGLFYYTVREELSFSGSPSKWMEGLYQELGALGAEASPEDIAETLSTIGSDLYEKLFPRELKEIWKRRIRGKVRSIMIISDEPWIPWEIVKPSYETETGDIVEDDFLCESYLLTRWIAGPPPPSLIEIRRGALIAPVVSELPNVQREIAFLMKSLGNVKEIEPRLAVVRRLLRTGGFHLIHFACHGSFDPEEHEQSIIYLQGDDRLKSRDIAGERRNFGKDRPFVFINACQTARADFSLVGIGSWADKFVNAKSSGFLGSSWEVNDELACRFSTSFYDALLEGKTIGEAMREARLEIRGEPDPTWLAYTLYADPLAEVVFV